ncbi:DSBA oxidoreductase [Verrucomicrobia bacterium]|nr:DSBA oxidoreductase [Verrucomicrobiota bacterium]
MKRDIFSITEPERLAVPVTRRDHTQGPADATLTLLEYGDFECPVCGMAYPVIKTLQHNLRHRLRFVFRHFPLTNVHPHAEHAAEAAEAAGARGAFWKMHDLLFENQDDLEDEDLLEYAAALGLDTAVMLAEIEAGAYARRIREDFMSGVRSGVNGTPTFFINGMRYDGSFDVDSLLAGLEEASELET